jgi:hypothetical protein
VDPLAPIARTGNGSYNVLHVLAYHRSKQNDALSPPKPKRGEPLEICLNGHRLKDDGAWALADAIRSGGGGGALRVLALQANGLSGDGVGSLCTALASGAALKLESLSRGRLNVEATLNHPRGACEEIAKRLPGTKPRPRSLNDYSKAKSHPAIDKHDESPRRPAHHRLRLRRGVRRHSRLRSADEEEEM